MADSDPQPAALLRDTLPSIDAAVALFDAVTARLGDRAVVLTSNEQRNRVLYLRAGGDGGFIIPWPLLKTSQYVPAPGEPTYDEDEIIRVPKPEHPGEPVMIPFTGFRPVPASISVHDGDLALGVSYRFNGRCKDSSAPADPGAFADFVPLLSRAADDRLEQLAEFIASMDLGRHGPARVLLPRETPGGVEGAWRVACSAIRAALASGRAPGGSCWAMADGYVGEAIAFGKSREETVAAWSEEVARVRPKPPPPADLTRLGQAPEAESWGRAWTPDKPPEPTRFTVISRGWDALPFDPAPEAVPGAVVRVASLPSSTPARGVWSRWLGDRGTTHFAVRLPSKDGFTLVGESLVPRFDLEAVEGLLDTIDEERREWDEQIAAMLPSRPELPPGTSLYRTYRCVDAATKADVPPHFAQGGAFDPRHFDGATLRWALVRVRRNE